MRISTERRMMHVRVVSNRSWSEESGARGTCQQDMGQKHPTQRDGVGMERACVGDREKQPR